MGEPVFYSHDDKAYELPLGEHPLYAAPQPAEPVKVPTKWSGWACQYPGKMPRLYGDKSIAMLNHHPEEGDRLLYLVEQSNPIPEPVNPPTREQIREVFLANGFTIKPGQDDLKEYVYEAARALLERYRQCS